MLAKLDLRPAPQTDRRVCVAWSRQVQQAVAASDRARFDDLMFIEAWERGVVPGLSAILRARQIRRATLVPCRDGARTRR
jgi:hypothetical protein